MGNSNSSAAKALNKRCIKNFGYVVDIPDARDIYLNVPNVNPAEKVDIRNMLEGPKVFDQGQLGSCTAFTVLTALLYDLSKNRNTSFSPSAMFLYYHQQLVAGHPGVDGGGSLRDSLKILNKLGTCSEEFHVYDTVFYTDKPSRDAYINAEKNRVPLIYKRLRAPTTKDLMSVLMHKVPVMFGFTVYESFESEETRTTGTVRMPSRDERILGAASAVIVGYNARTRLFTCANSRGIKWGSSGHFWVPFEFMSPMYCADFWVLYTGLGNNQRQPSSVPRAPAAPAGPEAPTALATGPATPGAQTVPAVPAVPAAPAVPDITRDNVHRKPSLDTDAGTLYEFREEDNVSYDYKSDDESRD